MLIAIDSTIMRLHVLHVISMVIFVSCSGCVPNWRIGCFHYDTVCCELTIWKRDSSTSAVNMIPMFAFCRDSGDAELTMAQIERRIGKCNLARITSTSIQSSFFYLDHSTSDLWCCKPASVNVSKPYANYEVSLVNSGRGEGGGSVFGSE